MPFKIEHLTAFIATDDQGEEGLAAWFNPHSQQWMPLIAADHRRLTHLLHLRKIVEQQSGRKLKMVRFTHREDVNENEDT